MKRLLFGFTLVEVIVSLTIASSGAAILHQGVMQALRAEERRRYYELCASFMDRRIPGILENFDASNGPFEIPITSGLPIKMKIEESQATSDIPDAVDLLKYTITFSAPGFNPGPVVTYRTPRLRTRQEEN